MAGFIQILFLIAITAIAGAAGGFFRLFDLSGLELWFPLGLIISYAINPLAGIAVAISMMLISWLLLPYAAHLLAISAATGIGVFLFAVKFLPVTEINFGQQAIIAVAVFQIVANGFYILTGHPLIRIARFVVVNMLLSWILFYKVGWKLVLWLR